MAKQTQIEKAIAQLQQEIVVLELTIAKLRAQQPPKKPAKPRAVPHVQAG
jgi:hypothetical protein